MSTIKPLNDYLLLEKLPSEKKVGSIVLTTEKKQGNVATVLAIGPGKYEDGKLLPIENIKVGNQVIYREYAGTEYEEDNHKYLLVKEEDVIAVVND